MELLGGSGSEVGKIQRIGTREAASVLDLLSLREVDLLSLRVDA